MFFLGKKVLSLLRRYFGFVKKIQHFFKVLLKDCVKKQFIVKHLCKTSV